jgi:hypothetical protein
MGDKRVLSDDDINTTWRRAGGSAGLTADPDSTDSDGTDGDGAGGDGTDGDSDGTDTKDS